MNGLSVVLATRNEQDNLPRCLNSVKDIADEIIIVDEESTDDTAKIARSFGAKVFEEPHHDNFHITKQKAIEEAKYKWILQLDADEALTKALSDEIKDVITMSDKEIEQRKNPDSHKNKLFLRHQANIEDRDGKLGKSTGEYVAFFVPRINMFLGKPLIHAGVYPDGVIRLIKKGKAFLPAKSVHEQMVIGGEVSWLFNDLEHNDSPTISRYLLRLNRYTDLHAQELGAKHIPKDIQYMFIYVIIKPSITFLKLFIRHKGYLDGLRGFLWSVFSAWHFPIAYFKYWTGGYN